MRNPGQKSIPFIDSALTLTTSFVASGTSSTGVIADVTDYTESSTYITYVSSTIGNSLQYKLEFSNDGTNWHPEPDEAVSSGVATVVLKSRDYVSLTAVTVNVPVLSMPVNDKFMRIAVKETLGGGGAHGTVTVNSIISKLN